MDFPSNFHLLCLVLRLLRNSIAFQAINNAQLLDIPCKKAHFTKVFSIYDQQFQVAFQMKRHVASYQQFRAGIDCASIRLNAEDQNEIMEIRNTNKNVKDNKPQARRYQENSLNGFEQSLSMSANQDNILELMRSKSATNMKPKEQKPLVQQKSKITVENLNSLYNTSSFDEMTMKMSINNKTNNNISHLHNLTNMTENQEQRKLRKPSEMQKYKVTYTDHQMKIMISQINRGTQKTLTTQEEIQQNQHQREKNVNSFIKNQSLLRSLKCSNANSQPSQNFQESSYQQPYFKAVTPILQSNILLQQQSKIETKQPSRRPDIHVVIPKPSKSPIQGHHSSKSPNNKLTLRDYIHLTQLTTKPIDKDKDPSQSSINSPFAPLSDRRSSFSRKKKTTASNNEVLARIKGEISADLRLMQNNIHILSQYFAEEEENEEPLNSQIMKIYTVSRMIKQKMLMGNDQIVNFLKGNIDRNRSTKP